MASNLERKSTTGTGIPVPGNDIDTDRIIPARFMKCVTFDGLEEYAFYDVRYDAEGNKLDHSFNDPKYGGGSILIANKNFGCGSSREHAPQSLVRFGMAAIVAESFAEIFAGNCTSLGVPAVTASQADVDKLMAAVEADPKTELCVDLEQSTVTCGDLTVSVTMPEAAKQALISGTWDTTAQLLANKDAIATAAGNIPYLDGFSS